MTMRPKTDERFRSFLDPTNLPTFGPTRGDTAKSSVDVSTTRALGLIVEYPRVCSECAVGIADRPTWRFAG
jgi:hypothetical protein